jgi:hypothetical protein
MKTILKWWLTLEVAGLVLAVLVGLGIGVHFHLKHGANAQAELERTLGEYLPADFLPD